MIRIRISPKKTVILVVMMLVGWTGYAGADYGVNLPTPATPGARDIYEIHMHTMLIATVILAIVFFLVFYSVYVHRKSRGYQADQNFHKTWFGHWSWVIVPAVVLGVDLSIAGNAQRVLEDIWLVPKDEDMMEVKVIAHQWYWEFEYLDHDVAIASRYVPAEQSGDLYLREVDNPLVLPTDTRIRFLHTSADVLHAFWVPELGFKKDAIPGYVTETWAVIDREGVFRGQCAELCGTWHARMPLVVKAVSPAKFDKWVTERKAIMQAAAQEAAADKTWAMEDLMERGKALYNKSCSACHQLTGEGLLPAFPALKAGSMATGPLDAHLDIVLRGKPGTSMQAWSHLNDFEIAAIITYERNAWGNNTGDTIQPAAVAAARKKIQARK